MSAHLCPEAGRRWMNAGWRTWERTLSIRVLRRLRGSAGDGKPALCTTDHSRAHAKRGRKDSSQARQRRWYGVGSYRALNSRAANDRDLASISAARSRRAPAWAELSDVSLERTVRLLNDSTEWRPER